jgi:hypothetical protein
MLCGIGLRFSRSDEGELATWMKKYYPLGSVAGNLNVYDYTVTQAMVAHDSKLPMLLPGIIVAFRASAARA